MEFEEWNLRNFHCHEDDSSVSEINFFPPSFSQSFPKTSWMSLIHLSPWKIKFEKSVNKNGNSCDREKISRVCICSHIYMSQFLKYRSKMVKRTDRDSELALQNSSEKIIEIERGECFRNSFANWQSLLLSVLWVKFITQSVTLRINDNKLLIWFTKIDFLKTNTVAIRSIFAHILATQMYFLHLQY